MSTTSCTLFALHGALPIIIAGQTRFGHEPGIGDYHRLAVAQNAIAAQQHGALPPIGAIGLDGDQHVMGQVAATVEIDRFAARQGQRRSEEHTSELQSLMRSSYAVFCLKKQQTKLKY